MRGFCRSRCDLVDLDDLDAGLLQIEHFVADGERELLRLLLDRDVTIYTTDASACLIKSETRAQLIVVGGEFNYVNSSFCGSMTESILRDLYFDKAFIGTNAIDEDRGVMTPSYVEAAKKRVSVCA